VLFAFLLRVRRVQLCLQQCWALAMNRRHLRYAADSPSSTKWWLRNHMAFVVDNLQYYLQVGWLVLLLVKPIVALEIFLEITTSGLDI